MSKSVHQDSPFAWY